MSPYVTIAEAAEANGVDLPQLVDELNGSIETAPNRARQDLEDWFAVSRQDLAEMAATTLHAVSRTMSGWEERGVVQSRRRRVIVPHPDTLLAIAVGEA